jgi:hypothetical protein
VSKQPFQKPLWNYPQNLWISLLTTVPGDAASAETKGIFLGAPIFFASGESFAINDLRCPIGGRVAAAQRKTGMPRKCA